MNRRQLFDNGNALRTLLFTPAALDAGVCFHTMPGIVLRHVQSQPVIAAMKRHIH